MTYELQLKKNGILITKEWDSETQDFVERIIEEEDLLFHINDFICLEKGIKLIDVFYLISKDIDYWSIITACPFLEEIVSEALSSSAENFDPDNKIYFVELGWRGWVDREEDTTYMDGDFRGIGQNDDQFAIEFSPINELSKLPLILNEKLEIVDSNGEPIFVSKKKFNLGDLIRNIILEVSFFGTPEEKSLVYQGLKEKLDEDNIPTYNIQTEDYELKPCRICGKEARAPVFDKPDDMCPKCFKKKREN